MAEYIECKALLKALKEERKNGNFVFTSKWIKEIMDNLPEADVVPRSEVEWLYKQADMLSQEVMYNDDIAKMKVDEAKTEVARGIFEEIEKHRDKIHGIVLLLPEEIAELKKKYTGGE